MGIKQKYNFDNFSNILKNKKCKKDIKLLVEGKVTKNKKHVIQIKGMEISKELFNELGFKCKIKSKGRGTVKPKQPTTRELLVKFIDNQQKFNEQVSGFMEHQEKFNQILLSLPTIKKEINRSAQKNKEK